MITLAYNADAEGSSDDRVPRLLKAICRNQSQYLSNELQLDRHTYRAAQREIYAQTAKSLPNVRSFIAE